MTDGPALLAAILADPGDDTVRLVYADWLEENGQRERAEFIRLQIRMVRCKMCHRKDGTKRKDSYAQNCGRCKPGRLREKQLFMSPAVSHFLPEAFGATLTLGPAESIGGKPGARLSRGFVSALTCTWEDWSRHAAAILERQPVTTVTLAGKVPYTVAENAGGGFGWFDDKYRNWDDGGYGTDPDSVPRALIEAMEKLGLGTGSNRERFFKTEAEALAALSDACIAWGREQIPRPLPDHLTARNT